MELKEIILSQNLDKILIQGRVSKITEKGVPLFWTGSALELNVTGTALYFEYECTERPGGMYMRIEIDGADIARFMVLQGTHKVCAFIGLEAEKIKNVRILRDMQANMPTITIKKIHTDGELRPPTIRKHKIEFIGDSITAGEGLGGNENHNRPSCFVFSSRGNYAILTANALNADYSIVALSGYGIYSAWDGNRNNAMPKQYPYVCKVANYAEAISLASQEKFDFTHDKTDIVVITLGTNDCSAFKAAPWTDENGVTHKLELSENGKPCIRDRLIIKNAIVSFCENIRATRPDAFIFWCYNYSNPLINDIVVESIGSLKDDKAFALKMIPMNLDDGSRGHPGPISHTKYSEMLVEQIKNIIG